MKLTSICAGALLFVAGAAFAAEALYVPGPKALKFTGNEIKMPADGCMEIKLPVWGELRKQFKIDPAKTYVISGEYRWIGGEGDSLGNFYIGIGPRTADGKELSIGNVQRYTGFGIAELAVAVKKGDTELKFKNGGKFKATCPWFMLAFNAAADGSDMPNFNLSPYIVENGITTEGEITTVKLKKPMPFEVAAGTKTAMHLAGNAYIYLGAQNPKLSGEWKKLGGKINFSGKDANGNRTQYWYKGSSTFRLVIFDTNGKGKIEVRNFSLTEE